MQNAKKSEKSNKLKAKPKIMNNKFSGADDIYLTPKKIAGRRIKTTKNNLTDTTTYYAKNKRDAQSIFGAIRNGR